MLSQLANYQLANYKPLEQFLIELGQGFAFVGRQYHIEVSDNDFYIDLLFYHLKLRSYIVIELKKGHRLNKSNKNFQKRKREKAVHSLTQFGLISN